jgi:glucokinase
MREQAEAIGVDLGGTKIEVGRVSQLGKILNSIRLDTHSQSGPEGIIQQIVDAVVELKNRSHIPIIAIGVGTAGQVDAESGMVYFSPNLPNWHNVPLKAVLEQKLGLPVKIINDVRAITFGEWQFGAGKNCSDLVCVFVGTGIGGGIISEGKLLTGFSNIFGEVGHMTIDLNGPICTCGNRGCWESLAGGWGIAKRTQEAVNSDRSSGALLLKLAGDKVSNITAKTVVEAYHSNDPLAKLILENVKRDLIVGCVNLVNLYNPQRLILGGGFLDGMPEMVPLIEQGIKQFALKAGTKNLEVVSAQLGKGVGVIGAAAAAWDLFRACSKSLIG